MKNLTNKVKQKTIRRPYDQLNNTGYTAMFISKKRGYFCYIDYFVNNFIDTTVTRSTITNNYTKKYFNV